MSTIERAIGIAAEAHAGQVDKAGAPYIFHVLRVMLAVETLDERMVAALHDVVEDTSWTFDRLREEGFSDEVVQAIESVTRRSGETYEEFVVRAGENPLGRRVKLADLADNSDLRRIAAPKAEDYARIERYRLAMEQLAGQSLRHSP